MARERISHAGERDAADLGGADRDCVAVIGRNEHGSLGHNIAGLRPLQDEFGAVREGPHEVHQTALNAIKRAHLVARAEQRLAVSECLSPRPLLPKVIQDL